MPLAYRNSTRLSGVGLLGAHQVLQGVRQPALDREEIGDRAQTQPQLVSFTVEGGRNPVTASVALPSRMTPLKMAVNAFTTSAAITRARSVLKSTAC